MGRKTRNTSSANTRAIVTPAKIEEPRKTIVLALAPAVLNIVVESALEDRVNERRNVLNDLNENEKYCEQDKHAHHGDQPPASAALYRELIEFKERLEGAGHTRCPRGARVLFLVNLFNKCGVHNPLFILAGRGG